MSQVTVKWIDGKREPQCLPDLRFPNGRDIDPGQRPACKIALPYPAKRCGQYEVHCKRCNLLVLVTTAGRIDDPCSITVPCAIPAGWTVKEVNPEVLDESPGQSRS